MKTIVEMMEVMEHFDSGGEVEFGRYGVWVDAEQPNWDWASNDYRIKQAPKVTKYLCYDYGGQLCWWKDGGANGKRIPQLDMEVTE